MKKIVSIAIIFVMTLTAQAQKVTFFSQEFEAGVRDHIGLGTSEDVLQTQMDTITSLDLSGLSITDIRDAVYLTAVTSLDLSYNKITDLSPLLTLESLSYLYLNNNLLESINILAFVQTDNLEVDVANNYISDFSYFHLSTRCEFTIFGMNMQLEKNAPYFEINHFYAQVNDAGQLMVSYQGYTNMPPAVYLEIGSSQASALLDGDTHLTDVPGHPAGTTKVTLTNGNQSETTYVVPPADFSVASGETTTMETGLPDNYKLTSAYASVGTVEIVGNKLKYTAPETAVEDVVSFSYYQGSTIKGFSRFFLNRANLPGDVNGDREVSMADVMMVMSYILGENPLNINTTAADMNGDGKVTITDVLIMLDSINQP